MGGSVLALFSLGLFAGRVLGGSPLHHAAAKGDLARIRKLLLTASSWELNLQASDSSTPLMVAAALGHATIVDAFLLAGARTDLQDTSGLTALHWTAIAKDRENLLGSQLMPAGAGGLKNAKLQTVGDQVSAARALVEHGVNVDALDHMGWSALMTCAFYGQPAIADLLVKAGANPEFTTPLDHSTALDIATRLEQRKVARILRSVAKKKAARNSTPLFTWFQMAILVVLAGGILVFARLDRRLTNSLSDLQGLAPQARRRAAGGKSSSSSNNKSRDLAQQSSKRMNTKQQVHRSVGKPLTAGPQVSQPQPQANPQAQRAAQSPSAAPKDPITLRPAASVLASKPGANSASVGVRVPDTRVRVQETPSASPQPSPPQATPRPSPAQGGSKLPASTAERKLPLRIPLPPPVHVTEPQPGSASTSSSNSPILAATPRGSASTSCSNSPVLAAASGPSSPGMARSGEDVRRPCRAAAGAPFHGLSEAGTQRQISPRLAPQSLRSPLSPLAPDSPSSTQVAVIGGGLAGMLGVSHLAIWAKEASLRREEGRGVHSLPKPLLAPAAPAVGSAPGAAPAHEPSRAIPVAATDAAEPESAGTVTLVAPLPQLGLPLAPTCHCRKPQASKRRLPVFTGYCAADDTSSSRASSPASFASEPPTRRAELLLL